MLKVDPTLNHVPAKREHVVALMESINQPLVNIPTHGTAPTGAFILGTRNEHGYFTVFVYLHQPESKAVVLYVSEPRNLTPEQYKSEEAEALRFVESMGFLIDDVRFPTLNPSEQEAVMSRVPMFRPPERTVDLIDVADSKDVNVDDLEDALPPSSGPHQAPLMGEPLSGPPTGAAPGTGSSPPSFSGAAVPGFPPSYPGAPAPNVPAITGRPVSGPRSPVGGAPAQPPAGPASSPGRPESSGPGGERARDVQALKRIGRLLGTFSLLAALSPGLGCASTSGGMAPRALESQLDLGAQHLARGAWPDAVRVYRGILAEEPDNRDAHRGVGLAYWRLERLDDAKRHLERAIEIDPDWSMPRNELAVVLIEQDDCEAAEAQLRRVLDDIFYPTPEYAQHNLARALHCQGRDAEAIETLDAMLRSKPRFCLGYLTLSEIASESKEPEVVIDACERFVRYCEQDEQIRENLAPRYSALCYLRKGVAYAEVGDIESARAAFIRCEATGALRSECRRALETLPP
jgi:Tfp pilus assembly protein PilF